MPKSSSFHAFFQEKQSALIEKLNAYFEDQGLSLKLSSGGICNGLCSLRTKYILKGDEKTFKKMIEAISNMRKYKALPEDLNQFIIELCLTAAPSEFDNKLNELTSMEAIPFTQEPLKAALNVSMVTSELNWISVMRDIALQEGEALLVANHGHIVSISKQGDQYHLYDPNFGFHLIDTEKALVQALNDNVFLNTIYSQDALGLNIRLMQSPLMAARPITLTTPALYENYLAQDISQSIRYKSKDNTSIQQRNSLEFALGKSPDSADIKKLMAMGFPLNKDMVTTAIYNRASLDVCVLLMNQLEGFDDKDLLAIATAIISFGTKEMLDFFLFNETMYKIFMDNYCTLTSSALTSGNGEMLEYFFLKSKTDDRVDANNQLWLRGMLALEGEYNPLSMAIDSGSSKCVRVILGELDRIHYTMTPAQHQAYLLKAIQSNHFHVVRQLIEITPSDQLKTMHLRLSLVEKTNLPVLRLLQQSGIEFSNNAKAIFAQKEQHWVNILRWILCVLEKIKDYFLDKPLLSSKINVNSP